MPSVLFETSVNLETGSCCPVCLKPLKAVYRERGDEILLEKECPQHGFFSLTVWKGSPSWEDWQNRRLPGGKEISGSRCSLNCNTCTDHLENICCVLLEVTNRCDQGCAFCFASAKQGFGQTENSDPSLEEISEWYSLLKKKGGQRPYNIHLSGGEPTLHNDLPRIIAMGKEQGFPYLQLNTNGRRIAEEPGYAESLKKCGLSVVFLQFDGTEDGIYRKIRGKKLFELKKRALRTCREAGLPVVLAVTLVPGINTDKIGTILDFAVGLVPFVKGVHFQPATYFGRYPGEGTEGKRITLPEVLTAIETQTSGVFKTEHFYPSGSGHPGCAFHGQFLKSPEGKIRPKKRPREDSSRAQHLLSRDFVSSKWALPSQKDLIAKEPGETGGCCCSPVLVSDSGLKGWDEFLNTIRRETFTITGMVFQDAWTVDFNRLSRCYVSVLSRKRHLIPFCAYNLTSSCGTPLFREQEEEAGALKGPEL